MAKWKVTAIFHYFVIINFFFPMKSSRMLFHLRIYFNYIVCIGIESKLNWWDILMFGNFFVLFSNLFLVQTLCFKVVRNVDYLFAKNA